MNVDAHLTDVFTKHAKQLEESYKNKIVKYSIDDSCALHSTGLKVSGECVVDAVYYNVSQDCNYYKITDIATNEQYTVNQFIITLSEK